MPKEPSKEALEKAASIPAEAKSELAQLLAKRPIISRLAVYSMSSANLRPHLKLLLPSMAYYFVNGPWRHTWVAYGLDPRASSEHRFFQILECRNVYTPSRSSANVKRNVVGRRGGMSQVKRGELAEIKDHLVAPNAHIFDGVNLNGNFFIYQLCDLVFADTAIIVESPQHVANAVTEKEGWYKQGTMNLLREVVKRQWLAMQPSVKNAPLIDLEQEQADMEGLLLPDPSYGDFSLPSFTDADMHFLNNDFPLYEADEFGEDEDGLFDVYDE